MKIRLSALLAALIASASLAPAALAGFEVPAKPGIANAVTHVTFWPDGEKKEKAKTHKAHKAHKAAKAKPVHAHKLAKNKVVKKKVEKKT